MNPRMHFLIEAWGAWADATYGLTIPIIEVMESCFAVSIGGCVPSPDQGRLREVHTEQPCSVELRSPRATLLAMCSGSARAVHIV